MRLYWEVARRGFRRYATYRGATFAGVFTNSIFGFMMAYVFIALHRGRPVIAGWNVSDTLTYNWIAQGLLMVVNVWGWSEISLRVRTGDIVTDFSRPYDFQLYWLAQDQGRAFFHLLFRGIPPFVVGALVFSLRLPHHPYTWILFLVSVSLAVAVSFSVRFMLNLAAFWILDDRGVYGLCASVWLVLSGTIVPIPFFPDWLRNIVRLLPFPAMMQVPVDVFLERPGAPALLLFQVFWALALLAAGRLVLHSSVRRVVIQGG